MISGPLMRYLLVGAVNTAVGYGAILLLQLGLGVRPLPANACGYAIGLGVSYALNRGFTFRSRRSHRAGVPSFLAAALACYLLNVAVLGLALDALALPAALAQALAVAAYTVSFYLANRYVVFGRQHA